jgi:hypothetical protein
MLATRFKKLITILMMPALLLAVPVVGNTVQLDIGDASGTVGDTVVVAITTSDLTGLGVYAYELRVTWSTTRATLIGAPETATLTAPWGPVTVNPQAGAVDIAAAGATALSGAGTLINLRYVLGPGTGFTTLTFADLIFNEGTPADTLSNGSLTVSALPTITVTPNTGEIVVGDSLQFATSGGTPPYTYTSSDPVAADFLGTDYLKGLSPGAVTVTSEDDGGLTDTSNDLIYIRALSLTAGSSSGAAGSTILVPMTISDPSAYDLTSAQFSLDYDENRIGFKFAIPGSVANAAGWGTPVINDDGQGTLHVALAGSSPLAGPGTLVNLVFQIKPDASSGTPSLVPYGGLFNEVYPPLHISGTVAVYGLPVITVNPNTATIVVGDNVSFSVSGPDTPPLDWGVTNPAVATIDATGQLTATASGQTRVYVEDFLGVTDTTGVISICDLYLIAPDQKVWTVPTPVDISPDRDVTGLGIYGFELTLTFNAASIEVTGVTSTGTASEVWGQPVYNTSIPGQVIIVHAGATELSGSLPLVTVDMRAIVGNNANYTLTISNILFNEGEPCALVVNGTLDLPVGAVTTPPPVELEQNVPNPFNPETTIGYRITEPGPALLRIYDTSGALVRTLVDEDHGAAGRYEARWDGTNASGLRVASGVYLYRLDAGGETVTKKMVLLK